MQASFMGGGGGPIRKGKPIRARKSNITTDLKETGWTGVEIIDVGQSEGCEFV
jgi:hypothetical protein